MAFLFINKRYCQWRDDSIFATGATRYLRDRWEPDHTCSPSLRRILSSLRHSLSCANWIRNKATTTSEAF